MEAVAVAEGIQADDAAVDAEIAKLAEQYKMEEDKIRSLLNVEDIRHDLTMRKALDVVKGAVKKTAKKTTKKTDSAEGSEDEKPAKKKAVAKPKAKTEEEAK